MDGLNTFCSLTQKLIFGEESPLIAENRVLNKQGRNFIKIKKNIR